MAASPILVRPPRTDAELTEHVEGAYQAFEPDDASPDQVAQWQRSLVSTPGYRPEQVRSAYRDDGLVGGYFIPERLLRVGKARLATGCIGAVFTRPAYRKQGVATALMHDAIEYARAHEFPLLLLDGIPNFYYRYGYCDVFDVTIQDIDRKTVPALSPSAYSVRPFTQEDIASIVALYERHYGPYTGSFERSVEWTRHLLQRVEPERLLLACDPAGQPRGYLWIARKRGQAMEMAVDDWPAALALLQHHAHIVEGLEGQEVPEILSYYGLPPSAPALQWIADTLVIPEPPSGDPVLGWAVRETTFHHRYAAWMARVVSLPALTRAMLPEWRERWQRSLARWSGEISLAVGDEALALRIADSDVHAQYLSEAPQDALRVTPQEFAQVIFGYRPITRFVQALPADALAALDVLFPTGNTWIPRSDWF